MSNLTDPPTPEPGATDDELLPCGRPLAEVWQAWEDQVADEHQLTCPHCGQAVQELQDLETAVSRLKDHEDDGQHPDQDTAADALTRRVMNVVRLELRPGRPLPLADPPQEMWIMESVAARTVRSAAERLPGVHAGSCKLTPTAPDSGHVRVRLEITVPDTTPDLQRLADDVRTEVERAADAHIGFSLAEVDIRITDLIGTAENADEGTA
ncbi:Asp23/Gls24 family envelope stress response protein [Streptomyces sp. SID14478]|uniref:Asp23/Gls24 family envelope stress response protein n=1 Tax=Streptomyces sp. SID14478 TaxID=2706073 RepID=UPI0013DD0592|nr:Asp23/Gls24 family envelope stress response protein [Streptomyces sp. SID14478]NEB79512.1 Asp23/Gls24 family envelope stress response protein [Streptomyces sp. SID14478]